MMDIFWDFPIIYKIFLLSKVERSVSISNKNGICKFLHWLLNDSRLKILENLVILRKSQNCLELLPTAQSSSYNQGFVSTSKKFLKVWYY